MFPHSLKDWLTNCNSSAAGTVNFSPNASRIQLLALSHKVHTRSVLPASCSPSTGCPFNKESGTSCLITFNVRCASCAVILFKKIPSPDLTVLLPRQLHSSHVHGPLSLADRAFSVSAARSWNNSLPVEILCSDTLHKLNSRNNLKPGKGNADDLAPQPP